MDELEKVQAQITELKKQAENLVIKQKPVIIEEIKAKIKTYGITAKDLGFTGKTGVSSMAGMTVPAKYKHGDHTWTGRGRQPPFIMEYIAQGGKLEDLQIR